VFNIASHIAYGACWAKQTAGNEGVSFGVARYNDLPSQPTGSEQTCGLTKNGRRVVKMLEQTNIEHHVKLTVFKRRLAYIG